MNTDFIAERNNILDCLASHYIAHRGLFDNAANAPENTIPAFQKALDLHYGIELDVHISNDNNVVVTHDYNLSRICGVNTQVNDLSYAQLRTYPVFHSRESIPPPF